MDYLGEARKVFDIEIEALKITRDALDDTYVSILDKIVKCNGKVVLTAIGKPGHIASKIAATLSSLGTPAFFLHPAEAMHGDLGMISKDDVVIIISNSGESDEILRIIPGIKVIGAPIVAITSNKHSTLAKHADIVQILPPIKEACHLGLAPTSSTTVELCYGDALAVVASLLYGFKDVDFGKIHPAGALGKKLILRVEDLMHKDDENSVIDKNCGLKMAIIELNKKGLGAVSVIDEGKLVGIITDGDLRRQLEKEADIYNLRVVDVMSSNPITISGDKLAVQAMEIMKEKNISCLPVTNNGMPVGTIKLQDIIGVGIVG